MESRKIAMIVAALALGAVPALAQDDAKIWFSWSPKPVLIWSSAAWCWPCLISIDPMLT